jgi:hemerythrin-like domain-containing protein
MPSSKSSSASASASSRSASRADANARAEIIDMLKEDHKRARKAFRQFEKLDPEQDAEERRAIVEQTCAELKLHSTLEEELLYPAARDLIKEPDLVDEAEVEHATAKQLIEQLEHMSSDDAKYGATFTVLGEYVNHHIKEEEGEMFPQLEKAKSDWQSLCDEMNSRREELMQQLLPQEAHEETADAAASARSAASSSTSMRGAQRGTPAEQRAQAASGESGRDAEDDDVE